MKLKKEKNRNQFISRYGLILLSILFLMSLILFFSQINISDFAGIHNMIFEINQFVQHNRFPFLIWHILIILAIYVGWDLKVNRNAKKYNLTEIQIKKAKQFRYVIIVFVIVFDFLTHWY